MDFNNLRDKQGNRMDTLISCSAYTKKLMNECTCKGIFAIEHELQTLAVAAFMQKHFRKGVDPPPLMIDRGCLTN
jgi:hypothetical protein